jgi:hypothetical protein
MIIAMLLVFNFDYTMKSSKMRSNICQVKEQVVIFYPDSPSHKVLLMIQRIALHEDDQYFANTATLGTRLIKDAGRCELLCGPSCNLLCHFISQVFFV